MPALRRTAGRFYLLLCVTRTQCGKQGTVPSNGSDHQIVATHPLPTPSPSPGLAQAHTAGGRSGGTAGDTQEGDSTSRTGQPSAREGKVFRCLCLDASLARPRGKRLPWKEGSQVLAAVLVLISTHVSTGTRQTLFSINLFLVALIIFPSFNSLLRDRSVY